MAKRHKYYYKTDSDGIWIVWESPFKIEMFLVTVQERKDNITYWKKLKLFNRKRNGK